MVIYQLIYVCKLIRKHAIDHYTKQFYKCEWKISMGYIKFLVMVESPWVQDSDSST